MHKKNIHYNLLFSLKGMANNDDIRLQKLEYLNDREAKLLAKHAKLVAKKKYYQKKLREASSFSLLIAMSLGVYYTCREKKVLLYGPNFGVHIFTEDFFCSFSPFARLFFFFEFIKKREEKFGGNSFFLNT